MNNVITAQAPSGRTAIFARMKQGDEWVQVESIIGDDNVQDYTGELEDDDERRAECIDDMRGEDWGKDAPITMPAA